MQGNRIYGLDIVRAFSIIIVVLAHGQIYLAANYDLGILRFFLIDSVTVFFVLSGFLIGGILIRTVNTTDFNGKDLSNFWIRRWFRTLPNYFLILFLLTIYQVFKMHNRPKGMLQYFTFTQNIDSPMPNGYLYFAESWSLSIEEWFYAIAPFIIFCGVVFFKNIKRQKVILSVIVCGIIAVTLYRVVKGSVLGYGNFEFWNFNFRTVILTRLDSLMFGFLGAYVYAFHSTLWGIRKNMLFVIGLFILFILPHLFAANTYNLFFKLSLDAIGTLLILPKMNSIKTGSGPVYKSLLFVSAISYSMYLINNTPMQRIIMPGIFNKLGFNYTDGPVVSILSFAIYLVLTVMFSYLLYAFYEKPMMSLRDKFGKRRNAKIASITVGISPDVVVQSNEFQS